MNSGRMGRPLLVVLALLSIIGLRFDPYSGGTRGGVSFEFYRWQIAVAAIQWVLLIAALCFVMWRRYRLAVWAGILEAGTLVGVNVAYFLRDGWARLEPAPDGVRPTVLLLLAVGFRGLFVALAAWCARPTDDQ